MTASTACFDHSEHQDAIEGEVADAGGLKINQSPFVPPHPTRG